MARPGFRAYLHNWRAFDAPLLDKCRMAARNNWRKLATRSHCCGHPGEPGC